MNLRHRVIGIAVMATLAGGGWWYHSYSKAHPSTADAYLGRHVVRIAAQVSGPIQAVLVRNNQSVKAGELLVTINPAPFALAVRQAEAQLEQAKDSLAAADARVDAAQAQLALQHTRISAPANGVVGDFDLRPGSHVDAGTALFALIESTDVWVDGNFKETDLPRIRPGPRPGIAASAKPTAASLGGGRN